VVNIKYFIDIKGNWWERKNFIQPCCYRINYFYYLCSPL